MNKLNLWYLQTSKDKLLNLEHSVKWVQFQGVVLSLALVGPPIPNNLPMPLRTATLLNFKTIQLSQQLSVVQAVEMVEQDQFAAAVVDVSEDLVASAADN